MTAKQAVLDPASHDTGVIAALARFLERRLSRRGFLVRAAVTGSAVSVAGVDFVLKPQDAYAAICGPERSCASGWTAFCCSINKGVNQCPPGSFAGGWWKADGAAMCGGKARYIVDCHPKCNCGCGGGSAFCRQECWDCKPGCADDACDHRRHCRNVFRYGQCNTHIDCTGPVLCRTVSCTPPWQWANCSTASATDNATVAHNASCLPNWGPMMRRYTELGSQGSVLGASIRMPVKMRGGYYQRYTSGRMFWSHDTGAHYLRGPVLKRYRVMRGSRKLLGFPTQDSRRVPGGFGARFERGGIYQAPGHSAKAMWGAVHGAWLRSGGPTGPLGLPVSNQRTVTQGPRPGRYVLCRDGGVFQGRGLGAVALWGAAYDKFAALNGRLGVLGYPTLATTPDTDRDGRRCSRTGFQEGVVVTRAGGHTNAVWGPVADRWLALGGVRGRLGVPVSDLFRVAGPDRVLRAQFAHGFIDWNTTTGQVTVHWRG